MHTVKNAHNWIEDVTVAGRKLVWLREGGRCYWMQRRGLWDSMGMWIFLRLTNCFADHFSFTWNAWTLVVHQSLGCVPLVWIWGWSVVAHRNLKNVIYYLIEYVFDIGSWKISFSGGGVGGGFGWGCSNYFCDCISKFHVPPPPCRHPH